MRYRLGLAGLCIGLLSFSGWAEKIEKQGHVLLYYGHEEAGQESYRLVARETGYMLEGRGRATKPVTLRTDALTLVMDRDFNPQSFKFSGQTAGVDQLVSIEFKDQQAKIQVTAPGQRHESTLNVHPGTLVSPNGIMFPLILLERHLAQAKAKGRTQYIYVAPHQELSGQLTYAGTKTLELNKGTLLLDHFTLRVDPFLLDLYADKLQRLALVSNENGSEAYFNDYDRTAAQKTRLAKFTEEEVLFGLPDWKLKGFLTLPRNRPGKFPAVVLVSGSGAYDRDVAVGRSFPFRDIAHYLSSYGYAVLRFDQRVFIHWNKLQGLRQQMTLDTEIVEDAAEAVKLVAAHPAIQRDHIFLLGHEWGASLAPWIAQRAKTPLAGLILLAAPLRPIEERILGEIQTTMKADQATAAAIEEELQRVRRAFKTVRDRTAAEDTLVFDRPVRYWRDLLGRNPRAELHPLSIPLLILQAEKDYQVTMADFKLWQDWAGAAARPDTELKSFPKLNHFFLPVEGESNGRDYERESKVASEALEYMVRWLDKYSKPKP